MSFPSRDGARDIWEEWTKRMPFLYLYEKQSKQGTYGLYTNIIYSFSMFCTAQNHSDHKYHCVKVTDVDILALSLQLM